MVCNISVHDRLTENEEKNAKGRHSNGSRSTVQRWSRSQIVSSCRSILRRHKLTLSGLDLGLSRWNKDQQSGDVSEQDRLIVDINGFGSISRRQMRKPIIAAVEGGAYGGGMEMILNCDIVVASEDAKFALPEVKRGVVAIQGGTYTHFPTHHDHEDR
jgi:Enoyl-CoA hydratase/isomerase